MRPLVAVALLALAGCAVPVPVAPTEPGLVAGEAVRLDASQPAREPSIAALPDGTLFVAGYWGAARFDEHPPGSAQNAALQPLLWRSDDEGATWRAVDTSGAVDARGNSDVSLAASSDGRLYYASLVFAPIGETVSVGVTADRGASWSWSRIAAAPFVDRPWVRVAPDGAAHVVWNDAQGVHHAASRDAGASWSEGPLAASEGGAGGFDVGPRGELAIRLVPLRMNGFDASPGADAVLVSSDAGASWSRREVPGEHDFPADRFSSSDVPRAWDPIAFDAEGRLYTTWPQDGGLVLAWSDDLGATWTTSAVPTRHDAYFPFLRGRASGVAASWFEMDGPRVAALAALLDREGRGEHVVLSSDTGGADHGEYFELVATRDGLAAAVPRTDAEGQWLDFVRAASKQSS